MTTPTADSAARVGDGATRVLRVVVADDQLPFRVALRRMLRRADDIEVVGEAADGAEAVQLVEQLAPDLVLLDVRMPGMDGPTAAAIIAERWPAIAVALCSSHGADDMPDGLTAPYIPKESLTASVIRMVARRTD